MILTLQLLINALTGQVTARLAPRVVPSCADRGKPGRNACHTASPPARTGSSTNVQRELLEINQAVASLAVNVEGGAVRELREAVAVLKAARPELAELSLEELLAMVKSSGANGAKVSPPAAPDEITSIEALGLDDEKHPAGSRRWRDPGRLARGRER